MPNTWILLLYLGDPHQIPWYCLLYLGIWYVSLTHTRYPDTVWCTLARYLGDPCKIPGYCLPIPDTRQCLLNPYQITRYLADPRQTAAQERDCLLIEAEQLGDLKSFQNLVLAREPPVMREDNITFASKHG